MRWEQAQPTCLRHLAAIAVAVAAMASVGEANAEPDDAVILGFKLQAGGRWDNVRMCVASAAGVEGGPAFDISFFADVGVLHDTSIVIDVPVMRPVLFAAMNEMLQFEPTVALAFRPHTDEDWDLVVGPSLGLTLHYGPDYRSEGSGDGRLPSFFALGPRFGGLLGFDFKQPDDLFNFQLAIHPYFSPLIGIDDPDSHRGAVLGGMLEGTFRFKTQE